LKFNLKKFLKLLKKVIKKIIKVKLQKILIIRKQLIKNLVF